MAKKNKVNVKITKGTLITLVVIVLLAATALATLYFGFPATWDALVKFLIDDQTPPSSNLVFSEGELSVYYLNVGQGDSILTIFPDGKTLLIDGGDTNSEIANTITQTFEKLNLKTLNYVVLTHTDADHCGSLDNAISAVENVQTIYTPKIKSNDYDLGLSTDYFKIETVVYNNFVKASKNATYIEDGQRKPSKLVFLEDEIVIEDTAKTYRFSMFCRNDAYYKAMTKNNEQINDVSPISILEYNGRKLIFTGDANNSGIETSSEKNFLTAMKNKGYTDATFDADVLKVAHHGGKDSSGADFLDFIDCEYAVISVGGDVTFEEGKDLKKSTGKYDLYISQYFDSVIANIQNFQGNTKYDHPHRSVSGDGARLEQSGIRDCYYTVLNGTIKCNINKDGNIRFSSDKVPINSNGVITYQNAA